MRNKVIKFYVISFILIMFDQVTKIAVKGFNIFGIQHDGMNYGEIIPVIGNFLQWTYVENEGMAFGISFGWGKIFLSLLSIIASILIILYIYKVKEQLKFSVGLSWSLILAGAFGNGIDRCFYGFFYNEAPLFYGRVVDFILVDIPDIDFLWWHYSYFPVFNIADSCVTCGAILLLFVFKHIPGLTTNKTNI